MCPKSAGFLKKKYAKGATEEDFSLLLMRFIHANQCLLAVSFVCPLEAEEVICVPLTQFFTIQEAFF